MSRVRCMSRRSNNICKISRSAIFRVYTTLDRKSEENVDTADTRVIRRWCGTLEEEMVELGGCGCFRVW